MEENTNWTFKRFGPKLDELDPLVRNKALEISNSLMETGKFSEEAAIEEGISRAEEWIYDLEG